MTNETVTQDITPETDLVDVIDAYIASWNERDPDARAELIGRVWVEGGRHVDPLVDAVGHTALDAMVAGLHEQFPGHLVRRTTGVDAQHEYFRFGWDLAAPDGTVVVVGTDVGLRSDDGRIGGIAGFFGELPEI